MSSAEALHRTHTLNTDSEASFQLFIQCWSNGHIYISLSFSLCVCLYPDSFFLLLCDVFDHWNHNEWSRKVIRLYRWTEWAHRITNSLTYNDWTHKLVTCSLSTHIYILICRRGQIYRAEITSTVSDDTFPQKLKRVTLYNKIKERRHFSNKSWKQRHFSRKVELKINRQSLITLMMICRYFEQRVQQHSLRLGVGDSYDANYQQMKLLELISRMLPQNRYAFSWYGSGIYKIGSYKSYWWEPHW